jgi:DNA-binding NarL/FixJ family response regulator
MRIVSIAGEPAFRLGLRVVVESDGALQLIADAEDARSGFALVDTHQPDLVIIDVALRGISGIDAIREIKRRAPKARVLLLAAWARERDVLDGFAAGADGFALKTDRVETLKEAIHAVGAGERYLTAEVRGLELDVPGRAHLDESRRGDVLQALSQREREVLSLVVKGSRSRDIARELCISIKTVETHRNHINRKLGCGSAADLTRFAADNGLLRSAPAAAARAIMVVVADEPAWRAQFVRKVEAQGYRCGRAPTATLALAELQDAPEPSLLVIDDGSAVRMVASLPASEIAGDLSVLEAPIGPISLGVVRTA